jgi:hypothetical protein
VFTQIEDAEQTVFSVQTNAHAVDARFERERQRRGATFDKNERNAGFAHGQKQVPMGRKSFNKNEHEAMLPHFSTGFLPAKACTHLHSPTHFSHLHMRNRVFSHFFQRRPHRLN